MDRLSANLRYVEFVSDVELHRRADVLVTHELHENLLHRWQSMVVRMHGAVRELTRTCSCRGCNDVLPMANAFDGGQHVNQSDWSGIALLLTFQDADAVRLLDRQ